MRHARVPLRLIGEPEPLYRQPRLRWWHAVLALALGGALAALVIWGQP